ncbi:MAG: carbohydrate ABC transporter permease [Butyrivibrio sp.]|nr:carbohydrate ABC transporter permease [Butyrivibrio sp.]
MIHENKAFKLLTYFIMAFLVCSCVIPFVILISSSFSSEASLANFGYGLFPKEFSLKAYEYIGGVKSDILHAYLMSFIYTAVGTIINVILSLLFAYPLSVKDLPGRKIISFFLFFTMLFNGGFVPTYLIYSKIFHINDSPAAMIVPYLLMNPFFVIMIRTYMTTNIPTEVLEAGRIDGAGEGKLLYKVVLPMSKPIIGTVALMTAIAYWNNWTNGIYFLTIRRDLYGIQNYLNQVLSNVQFLATHSAGFVSVDSIPNVSIRMALAVIAVLPVLIAYPFFQKTFVAGITVGSVKG